MVSYDNDAEGTAANATSITLSSFVVANNADRYMILGFAGWDTNVADSVISGVTWNGSATGWSELGTEVGPGAAKNRATLWGLLAPTATTANVVVTMAGTCSEIRVNVLSAYGVDQTTPVGTFVSGEGTGANPSITVASAADDLVYDVGYLGAAHTVGSGQTQRANTVELGASTEPAVGATTVMSWTMAAGEWVQVGIAIKNLVAAGGHPAMSRWLGIPGMTPGPQFRARGW